MRFENGRTQVGPALKRKNPRAESEFYLAAGDRRNNKGWVTVKRDREGLQHDVQLFQELLNRGASETEMHRFFEEHPAILMQARMGIPISHQPRFVRPKDNRPDFAFSSILGTSSDNTIALMELKGPSEPTLTRGFHPGFAARVHRAIDQLKDYEGYLRDPANIPAIMRAFGFLPESSNLAVLIGRSPQKSEEEVWGRRQQELDVEIVTYDEILEVQKKQLERPAAYTLRYGTSAHPLD